MALLTVETLQGISNLTISADLHGCLALEESFNWKNQLGCMFSKTLSLDINYKTLQLA